MRSLWVLVLAACAVDDGRPVEVAMRSFEESIAPDRKRARDLGIHIGKRPSGALDAITDVPGVAVGHSTLRTERFNTGVTVILPPGDNPFRDKLNAAVVVQNGYGKFVGSTQIVELGQLESPIALTGTLNVHRVADGLLDWLLGLPGNEDVRSANVVVGETNDSRLSDIRARPVTSDHVRAAIESASSGPMEVGAVGAGAGTICFGWKGGIGTSSRRVGAHTIGVLVQTNFGGNLVVDGVPVYRQLHPDAFRSEEFGSCVIVVATDAPLDSVALQRVARRSFAGMARTGASFSNGSGDYAIAFSTTGHQQRSMSGTELSPLFLAVADATEQAILDSLCAAETTRGYHPRGFRPLVWAIPLDRLEGLLRPDRRRPF